MSKRILFIAPNFFEYHILIKKELENQGYEVDWFDDRPNPNIIEKCILRVRPSLLNKKVDNYFNDKILKATKKKKYDFVLVILGQCLNSCMCEKIKKELPNARFVMYLWDSIKNFPQCLETSKQFEKVFSFDRRDCDKYGFTFMPLFYTFSAIADTDSKEFYDVTCICTIKKGKYDFIKKIKQELDKKYKKNYFYLFLQSKIVWAYYKIKLPEFKKTKINDFVYKKVSYTDALTIINKSKIVLDVQMQNQNGLTMRTFESLALGKKIITTNADIKNYDFYDKKRIYVYEGKNIDFDDIFFNYDFNVKEDLSNFQTYSLENWVKKILN